MISDRDYLRSENEKMPVDPPPYRISEWVQGRRVMPANTPFPGFWDNEKTPYAKEIMDNMSPFSPVITTSVKKSAQVGLTAAAENIVGYWMSAMPAEVLYVSADESLLENWSTKRLEPLIDSIGMRDKITAQIDPSKAKSRRSGDKILTKEYPGGTLNMASARSASSLRSDSKRVLILDEVDGAPRLLKTGEGTWLDVAYARTNAWSARKRILEFSTPTTIEDSLIEERYQAGDQRKYNVPCPHCGTMQELLFRQLRHEMKDGQLFRVWYECPHCLKAINNHQKTAMLSAGEWVPTAQPIKRGHRSYHISALYSPVGMFSWYELYEKYLEAKRTPGGMRSFVNLYLGQPYKERGSRPKVENVMELRGDYMDGTVPDGVLYLTAGIDVQQGSSDPKAPKEQGPRLEMEVVGHGLGWRTASIAYKVFYGPVTDPHEGAWKELIDHAVAGGLKFRRSDGAMFPISLAFIDSGDGTNVDTVYNFTRLLKGSFASKGVNALKKRKEETGDEVGPANFKRYRAARSERSGDVIFYEISTNYYKSHVYSNLKIQRRDEEPHEPPGFCNFPRDRGEKFFLMLTAEEKRVDGSFHAGGRRNEALDCRVMALCAADVYLDAKVSAARAAAKSAGSSDLDLQKINHALVLEGLVRSTARRML